MMSTMSPELQNIAKPTTLTRKCSYCQKMVLFRKFRCKYCRYRCHKKCSLQRNNSYCQRAHSGEEHWTKVLQANEVNSNLIVLPGHGRQHPQLHRICCERVQRGRTAGSASPRGGHHHHGESDAGLLSTLYDRFCRWVSTARREIPASRSSSLPCGATVCPLHGGEKLTGYHHRRLHASVSSDDSYGCDCINDGYHRCGSISGSNGSLAGNEPWWKSHHHHHHHAPLARTCSTDNCRCGIISAEYNGNTHVQLASTLSCPAKSIYHTLPASPLSAPSSPPRPMTPTRALFATTTTRTRRTTTTTTTLTSSTSTNEDKERLCATWPPQGNAYYSYDNDDAEVLNSDEADLDESVFGDFEEEAPLRNQDVDLRESLGECSIPYKDLVFGECIKTGRRHECHKGRWHGEVMIHTYCDLSETELLQFWEEVSKLSMLRHENIALFMGACIDPPRLAVITSVIKGASLYEHLHVRADAMAMRMRVNVARQVAQGMGYLHARGVVVRKLNSKNIFLDPKVKLCLTDYGMAEKKHDRSNYGCMPRGHLTYIAPEVMMTLRVVSPRIKSYKPCTNATNVYAFGTILYELVNGHYPFCGLYPESIIWQVSSGQFLAQTSDMKCSATLKCLIEQCWSHLADGRPTFAVIAQELQVNAALHKRHSSSQPERINHSGLSGKPLFGH